MRLFLLIFILSFKFFNLINAGDVCGSSINSFQIYWSQNYHFNSISLRYSEYFSTATSQSNSTFQSNEYFRTIELIPHIIVSPKLKIIGSFPFNTHLQIPQNNNLPKTSTSAIGDLSVLGLYQLWSKKKYPAIEKNKTKKLQAESIAPISAHSIWLGFGFKLPFGNYDEKQTTILTINSNQIATGSLDILTQFVYQFQKNKYSFILDANYKINSNNTFDYQFGNRLNTNVSAFYKKKWKSFIFSPSLGVGIEMAEKNEFKKKTVEQSGFYIFKANGGVEIKYKNLMLTPFFSLPIAQNISTNLVQLKYRFWVQLTYQLSM